MELELPGLTVSETRLSDINVFAGNPDIILLGAGGHAKVILDALRASGARVAGIVDPDLAKSTVDWRELVVLGDDDYLLTLDPDNVLLVNGLGSIPGSDLRKRLFEKFKSSGFNFYCVSHPSSILGSNVYLGEGAQLMAGTIVQADSRIGSNTIVNTGARIDHDCDIGADCHIAPGAVISGGVTVGDGVHIGTGASVIQGLTVGLGAVIGAGTVVVRNVPENARVLGRPPTAIAKQDLE